MKTKTIFLYYSTKSIKTEEAIRAYAEHGYEFLSARIYIERQCRDESGDPSDRVFDKIVAAAHALRENDDFRGQQFFVATDATVFEIYGLNKMPGCPELWTTKLGRGKRVPKPDLDVVRLILQKMEALQGNERRAMLSSMMRFALVTVDGIVKILEPAPTGHLLGEITYVPPPLGLMIPGMPLDAIFNVPEANGMALADIRRKPWAERRLVPRTHLERAVLESIPILREHGF